MKPPVVGESLSPLPTCLPADSVANASQIATLNKEDLETLVGSNQRGYLPKSTTACVGFSISSASC